MGGTLFVHTLGRLLHFRPRDAGGMWPQPPAVDQKHFSTLGYVPSGGYLMSTAVIGALCEDRCSSPRPSSLLTTFNMPPPYAPMRSDAVDLRVAPARLREHVRPETTKELWQVKNTTTETGTAVVFVAASCVMP